MIDRYASPKHAYTLACSLTPWCAWISIVLFLGGVYGSLVYAPPDYDQGDAFRIIYVHVPAAWMSMFVYVVMALAGACGLIWKVKLMDGIARSCAPLGASFTLLALVTGSIWGKPMWGTWWVWDARLTSELILLFLYLGYMALQSAIDDRRTAARAGAILALVGVVNIPIIHFSVEWWNTLHQGPTVTKLDQPSIHVTMLIPLLIMSIAYTTFFISMLMVRLRTEILDQERNSSWVRELVMGDAD
jgi:heme exporter protein C